MSDLQLDECDVPYVRDLLLANFRDPHLEVEGKLGRRSDRGNFREKFTSGVNGKQFAELERRLCQGASWLGLSASAELPELEITLDRFLALDSPGEDCRSRYQRTSRLSFRCNSSGYPHGQPFEVLRKTRMADCHVANRTKATTTHPGIAIRISFSKEEPGVLDETLQFIFQRFKKRRTWEARLFRIQLTHVGMDDRESYEVEVELRMDVVRARLEDEASRADEAKAISCELSFAMRGLAAWVAEVPLSQKRKRLEDFDGALPALKAVLESPDVAHELSRRVSEGSEALYQAKCYLCKVLQDQCPSVDENVLFRFAGHQVGRALLRQKSSRMSTDTNGYLFAQRE
jgi:hypothetical protein